MSSIAARAACSCWARAAPTSTTSEAIAGDTSAAAEGRETGEVGIAPKLLAARPAGPPTTAPIEEREETAAAVAPEDVDAVCATPWAVAAVATAPEACAAAAATALDVAAASAADTVYCRMARLASWKALYRPFIAAAPAPRATRAAPAVLTSEGMLLRTFMKPAVPSITLRRTGRKSSPRMIRNFCHSAARRSIWCAKVLAILL